MEDSGNQFKISTWIPALIPFFATSGFYIYVLLVNPTPSLSLALVKCLPIFSLIKFVLSHNEDNAKNTTPSVKPNKVDPSWFKNQIALGLAAGAVGDAFLVFPPTFVAGMAAFALQHVFFINAYGFKPLKPALGISIYAVALLMFLFVQNDAPNRSIEMAMPFYSIFLVTMFWRSVSRINSSFPRRAGAIGGLLFLISDFLLVLNFQGEVRDGNVAVISTYYLSQLCTSITVLESSVGKNRIR